MPMRDAIAASAPTPFLIVAGGATHDEANAGRWFRSATPDRVELWIVPAAAHTGGLATEPEGWERRVIGFLDEMLLFG